MPTFRFIIDISELENLENLNSLQTLSVGNNKIKEIGNSLNGCLNLKVSTPILFNNLIFQIRIIGIEHLWQSNIFVSRNPTLVSPKEFAAFMP